MERINPTTPANEHGEFKTRAANGQEFILQHVHDDADFEAWSKKAHGGASIADMTLMLKADYCVHVEGKNNDVLKLKQDTQLKIAKIKDKLKKELRGLPSSKPGRTQRHSERAVKGSLSEGGSGLSRKRPMPTPPQPGVTISAWSSEQDGPPALEAMSAGEAKVSPLSYRTRTHTRTPSTPQIREKGTGNADAGLKVLGRSIASSEMNDLEECRDITKEKLIEKAQKKIDRLRKTEKLLRKRLETSATTSTGSTRETFLKYLDPLSGEDEKSEEACYPQDWEGSTMWFALEDAATARARQIFDDALRKSITHLATHMTSNVSRGDIAGLVAAVHANFEKKDKLVQKSKLLETLQKVQKEENETFANFVRRFDEVLKKLADVGYSHPDETMVLLYYTAAVQIHLKSDSTESYDHVMEAMALAGEEVTRKNLQDRMLERMGILEGRAIAHRERESAAVPHGREQSIVYAVEHKDERRKPGVCFAFNKGKCTRGDRCHFDHRSVSPQELERLTAERAKRLAEKEKAKEKNGRAPPYPSSSSSSSGNARSPEDEAIIRRQARVNVTHARNRQRLQALGLEGKDLAEVQDMVQDGYD